jgi:hypothetical protein
VRPALAARARGAQARDPPRLARRRRRRHPPAPASDARVHPSGHIRLPAGSEPAAAANGAHVPCRLPAPQPDRRRDLGRGRRIAAYRHDALPPAQARPANPPLPTLRRNPQSMTAAPPSPAVTSTAPTPRAEDLNAIGIATAAARRRYPGRARATSDAPTRRDAVPGPHRHRTKPPRNNKENAPCRTSPTRPCPET